MKLRTVGGNKLWYYCGSLELNTSIKFISIVSNYILG